MKQKEREAMVQRAADGHTHAERLREAQQDACAECDDTDCSYRIKSATEAPVGLQEQINELRTELHMQNGGIEMVHRNNVSLKNRFESLAGIAENRSMKDEIIKLAKLINSDNDKHRDRVMHVTNALDGVKRVLQLHNKGFELAHGRNRSQNEKISELSKLTKSDNDRHYNRVIQLTEELDVEKRKINNATDEIRRLYRLLEHNGIDTAIVV